MSAGWTDPGQPRRERPQVRPGQLAVVLDATADATWSMVTVNDEGVGVPERDRSLGLVPEPFHRAWNIRNRRFRHGPRPVHLRRADRGPRRPAMARRSARRAARDASDLRLPLAGDRGRAPFHASETILIIEDEPEFADLVELWMTRAGYRVVLRSDRPRRAATLRGAPGSDHPRRRHARPRRWRLGRTAPRSRRVPILMVTTRGSRPRRSAGLKLGADDYIAEPLSAQRSSSPASKRRSGGRRRAHLSASAASSPRPGHRPGRQPGPPAGDEGLRLTPTEFRLLTFLFDTPASSRRTVGSSAPSGAPGTTATSTCSG